MRRREVGWDKDEDYIVRRQQKDKCRETKHRKKRNLAKHESNNTKRARGKRQKDEKMQTRQERGGGSQVVERAREAEVGGVGGAGRGRPRTSPRLNGR